MTMIKNNIMDTHVWFLLVCQNILYYVNSRYWNGMPDFWCLQKYHNKLIEYVFCLKWKVETSIFSFPLALFVQILNPFCQLYKTIKSTTFHKDLFFLKKYDFILYYSYCDEWSFCTAKQFGFHWLHYILQHKWDWVQNRGLDSIWQAFDGNKLTLGCNMINFQLCIPLIIFFFLFQLDYIRVGKHISSAQCKQLGSIPIKKKWK